MKKPVYVAVLAAAALSLAACSSSSSSTPTGSGSSGGAPIKVMAIGQYTGQYFGYPEMADGTKAAIAVANAAGGVNGHQIVLTTCDDKGDPNTAAACARQAVTLGVSAVLGSISLFGGKITPLLEAAQIPYIGPLPVDPADTSSPIAYPLDGGTPPVTAGQVVGLKDAGCTKFGIMATNNGFTGSGISYTTKAIAATGQTLVKTQMIPPNAPDFTPYVSTLLESNPGCVVLWVATGDMVKVVTAFRQSSKPKMPLSATFITLPQSVVQGLKGGADGIQGVTSSFNPSPATTPTFIAQLKAENPSAPADNASELAWSAATAFVEVAKNISGDITGPSVLAQLGKTTALKLETYPAPINLSVLSTVPGAPHLFNYSALVYVVNGSSYELPSSTPIDTQPILSTYK